jgi:hypothetical protein
VASTVGGSAVSVGTSVGLLVGNDVGDAVASAVTVGTVVVVVVVVSNSAAGVQAASKKISRINPEGLIFSPQRNNRWLNFKPKGFSLAVQDPFTIKSMVPIWCHFGGNPLLKFQYL